MDPSRHSNEHSAQCTCICRAGAGSNRQFGILHELQAGKESKLQQLPQTACYKSSNICLLIIESKSDLTARIATGRPLLDSKLAAHAALGAYIPPAELAILSLPELPLPAPCSTASLPSQRSVASQSRRSY